MKNLENEVNKIDNILEVDRLSVIFQRRGKPFLAVNEVSFNIKKGEIFGLVGESGSGKTTTARSIIGLIAHDSGSVKMNGKVISAKKASNRKTREFMAKNMQMIFQDPYASLNPTKRVIDIVTEGIKNFNPFKAEGKAQKKIMKSKLQYFKKINQVEEKNIIAYEQNVSQAFILKDEINNLKNNKINEVNLQISDLTALYNDQIRWAKNRYKMIDIQKNKSFELKQKQFQKNVEQLFEKQGKQKWEEKWKTINDEMVLPWISKLELIQQSQKEIEKLFIKNLTSATTNYQEVVKIMSHNLDPIVIDFQSKIDHKRKLIDNLETKKIVKCNEIEEIIQQAISQTENEKMLKDLIRTKIHTLKVINSRYKTTKNKLEAEIFTIVSTIKKYVNLSIKQAKNIHSYRERELTSIRKSQQKIINRYVDTIEKTKYVNNVKAIKDKINFMDKEQYQQLVGQLKEEKQQIRKYFTEVKKEDYKKVKNIKLTKNQELKQKIEQLIKIKKGYLNEINKLKEQFLQTQNQLNDIVAKTNIKINNNKKEEIRKLTLGYKQATFNLRQTLKQKLFDIENETMKNFANNFSDENDTKLTEQLGNKFTSWKSESKEKALEQFEKGKTKLFTEYINQIRKVDYYLSIKKELKEYWKKNYSIKAVKLKTADLTYTTLKQVGLLPEHAYRYPTEFSGGQRQRIGVARAIIMNPTLLIADEPISALDVSIQAQVINILKDLRATQDLSILLIAHDLRMVNYLCDRIAVITSGRIVEIGKADEIFYKPVHPYTRCLISAVPSIDNVGKDIIPLTYVPSNYEYNLEEEPKFYSVSDEHYVFGTKNEIEKWTKNQNLKGDK